jgi:hypothetical protein
LLVRHRARSDRAAKYHSRDNRSNAPEIASANRSAQNSHRDDFRAFSITAPQKSSSRSMCKEIAHTQSSSEGLIPPRLKLSFSVQISPTAPAARASASISPTSAAEYR